MFIATGSSPGGLTMIVRAARDCPFRRGNMCKVLAEGKGGGTCPIDWSLPRSCPLHNYNVQITNGK